MSQAEDFRILREHIFAEYHSMFREAGEGIPYPFLTAGSKVYEDTLWDWDSWLNDVALGQILHELDDAQVTARVLPYERGCVLNFLTTPGANIGYLPMSVERDGFVWPEDVRNVNMHKPCLAQHAAFLVREGGGDAEWLREHFVNLQTFLNFYHNHHSHDCGLHYWQNDFAIGVDNDPCTFGRPPKSSGSILLNCLLYRELLAMEYLATQLNMQEIAVLYRKDATTLQAAVQEYCWDERDGFFYNVDLNIHRQELSNKWGSNWGAHCGYPCDWPCLIQRIDIWSGFMALWAGIATREQAERVRARYQDPRTFGANYGVRTLSKMEKMYNVRAMGNPSSWLGPIWGSSNYLTFRGFVRYGLTEAATDLAEKTVRLFARDIARFGAMHEYYLPDSGEPVLNRGFQNWNFLVLNMINWLEGKPAVEEF